MSYRRAENVEVTGIILILINYLSIQADYFERYPDP